jgi:hypothetical protein
MISTASLAAAPAAPRIVHQADALDWLARHRPLAGASVVTSLPDTSELPELSIDDWQAWFVRAAALTMSSVDEQGAAFFFQSDIRHRGVWIDKAALVEAAAPDAGMKLLFHKIVCRKPAGTASQGRATYSHLLGFSRVVRPPRRPTPDVLPDAGFVVGRKAMGTAACLLACRYILDETPTRTVVDPFCGWGTALAVANALGLAAVGVDRSARMCRRARALALRIDGEQVSEQVTAQVGR